ncbi:MAG: phage protein GemA/Gp16 family protein [Bacillota bacterium]
MAEPATKAQIKKIWITAKQLGMDEVDLRGLVGNLTGANSVQAMTKAQAIRLIDYLLDRQNKDYRPEMASRQQIWKIKQLAAELGWQDHQLKGFLRKYAGVESLRWLDARRAYNAIEGLKKLKERITQKNAAEK